MKDNFIKRLFFSVIGIIINALGVAFITTAALGTVPATSIPEVLGIAFKPTIGQFTFVLSVIQVAIQVAILRKKTTKWEIIQLIPAVILSYFIDFFMNMLKNLPVETYAYQILWLLVGCVVLAFAIALEVFEDVIYLPLDGMNNVISTEFKISFEVVKTVVDCVMVIVAVICSFVLLGNLQGVREGTVIAALIIGLMIKGFNKVFFDKLAR